MLYIIEMFNEDGIFIKRLVYKSELERDFNYNCLKRDYSDNFVIIKKSYKEIEEEK